MAFIDVDKKRLAPAKSMTDTLFRNDARAAALRAVTRLNARIRTVLLMAALRGGKWQGFQEFAAWRTWLKNTWREAYLREMMLAQRNKHRRFYSLHEKARARRDEENAAQRV